LNVKLRVAEKYPISNFHQKHAARREMKEKRKMFVDGDGVAEELEAQYLHRTGRIGI